MSKGFEPITVSEELFEEIEPAPDGSRQFKMKFADAVFKEHKQVLYKLTGVTICPMELPPPSLLFFYNGAKREGD